MQGQFYIYVPVEAQEVSMFSNSVETGSGGGTNVQGGDYVVRWNSSGITGKGWIVRPNGTYVDNFGRTHSYEEELANYPVPQIDFSAAYTPEKTSEQISQDILSIFNEQTKHEGPLVLTYVRYAVKELGCATAM